MLDGRAPMKASDGSLINIAAAAVSNDGLPFASFMSKVTVNLRALAMITAIDRAIQQTILSPIDTKAHQKRQLHSYCRLL